MENENKRPVGRPKASPPAGPLVLEGTRPRVKVELELATGTAAELKEYASWVESASTLAEGDALFTTVDFALRDVFRRDRLWQTRRRSGSEPSKSLTEAAPKQPALTTLPLPPPSASSRPVPGPPAPPTVR